MNKKSIFVMCFSLLALTIACNGENKTRTGSKSKVPQAEEVKNSIKDSSKSESKNATDPEQLAKAKEMISSISEDEIKSINAKKLFKSYCGICHGFKGNMKINGAKDLTISSISLEESVAQVYFGRGLMTPFKGVLKDAEIVALSKYAETLRKD